MCGCKKHLDESQQCTCICDEHANFEAARDLAMRRFDAIRELEAEVFKQRRKFDSMAFFSDYHAKRARSAEAERDAALSTIAKVREAVSGHPKCDRYEDGDAITCGWKNAYASVVRAIEEAPEVES